MNAKLGVADLGIDMKDREQNQIKNRKGEIFRGSRVEHLCALFFAAPLRATNRTMQKVKSC